MILGIGHDLTDIRRIERTIDKFGDRFLQRIFTDKERRLAEKRSKNKKQRAATYAKRFAAKEATVKALGTGVSNGVALKDIEITNDAKGRPIANLTGGAYRYLAAVVPSEAVIVVHLSLSDEPPYASAYVIIEACQSAPDNIMVN